MAGIGAREHTISISFSVNPDALQMLLSNDPELLERAIIESAEEFCNDVGQFIDAHPFVRGCQIAHTRSQHAEDKD